MTQAAKQNRPVRDVLIAEVHSAIYHEYAVGHAWACWRGTVARGVI